MINLGLHRTTRLLDRIAQQLFHQPKFLPPWKAAHIAGTNGKGSVAAYLSAILRHSRCFRRDSGILRVGRFTSPHFIDRWDCIQIDDRPVAENVFLETEEKVKKIAVGVEKELRYEVRTRSESEHLKLTGRVPMSIEDVEHEVTITEFELLTATAFTIFSQPDPDPCNIAVIECGMGGRLDATNVLPDESVAVSILTRIGLDHLEYLGGSLEGIVREKCGIIRPATPVVIDGDNDEGVLKIIQEQCKAKLGTEEVDGLLSQVRGFDVGNFTSVAGVVTDGMEDLMPHQWSNLAVAYQALHVLQRQGVIAPDSVITDFAPPPSVNLVLQQAAESYPARLQGLSPDWLDHSPEAKRFPHLGDLNILLDGAHNVQSAEVLRECAEPFNSIWVIALSSTKPPMEILQALFSEYRDEGFPDYHALGTKIVFTAFGPVDGMPWVKATPPQELLSCARDLGLEQMLIGCSENVVEALDHVERMEKELNLADNQPRIVIAGSLYLASDFLRFVRDGREAVLRRFNKT